MPGVGAIRLRRLLQPEEGLALVAAAQGQLSRLEAGIGPVGEEVAQESPELQRLGRITVHLRVRHQLSQEGLEGLGQRLAVAHQQRQTIKAFRAEGPAPVGSGPLGPFGAQQLGIEPAPALEGRHQLRF